MARAMPGSSDAGITAGLPGKLRRVVQRDPGKPGSKRPLKIAVALGLLGAGLYAMLDDQFSLSTETAVVSAYTVGLRSPIGGHVAGLRHAPGEEVAAGTLLAVVEDDRADQQRLIDLRALRDRARSELTAAETARETFRAVAADLTARAGTHKEVALAWYASQLAEAQRSLAGAQAKLLRDRQILDRKRQLVTSGFGTRADFEAAQGDHDVSLRTLEAQRQRIATLQTQRDGVRRGVFVESGHIGFNYAQQRQDEVTMRLADLERSIVSLRADVSAAEARLAGEQQHSAQQAMAELPSPSGGMVWRVLAQEGERVAAGDTVAEVMDCGAAFVLAVVPQDRAADVQVGGIARFRLSGESRERSGRVQAVLGEGSVASERNLAAMPARLPHGGALVRVALSPPAPGETASCPVGRSARLLLPTGDSSFLGRMLAAR
jgi:multidrug resistance efflux pump